MSKSQLIRRLASATLCPPSGPTTIAERGRILKIFSSFSSVSVRMMIGNTFLKDLFFEQVLLLCWMLVFDLLKSDRLSFSNLRSSGNELEGGQGKKYP